MSKPIKERTMLTKTAEGYRVEAAQHERNAAESFERCDTDGFLSQWASGINAQVARRNAEIAERGGVLEFKRTVLQRLDGTAIDAKIVNTRYGRRWRIDETDEWLPYHPARETTLAKRGYKEVDEFATAPAIARTWAPSGARGLAGATSVQVIVVRTDMPHGQHAREGWGLA